MDHLELERSVVLGTSLDANAALEVESLLAGYPVVHEFLPDLEGVYKDWLGQELQWPRLSHRRSPR